MKRLQSKQLELLPRQLESAVEQPQQPQCPVVGMDIEVKHYPNLTGNNLQMPCADACFDVVVYDPPHIPN
jgi:hypothetical protein